MKLRTLLATAASLAAADLHAQAGASCPAADSAVGPVARAPVGRRYDRVTDTTTVSAMKIFVPMLSANPGATMYLYAKHEGQTPSGPVALSLTIEMDVRPSSGRASDVSREAARLEPVEDLALLIDDSTRVRIPRSQYTSRVAGQGALSGPKLHEVLTFALTPDQMLAIARAQRRIEMAAGPVRMSLGRGEFAAAREMYRLAACAGAAGP